VSRCFVFVEGSDDERFFSHVVVPRLEQRYGDGNIQLLTYSGWSNLKIEQFLRSIAKIGDYIFVHDLDHRPCITSLRVFLAGRVKNLDRQRIQGVVREIEGWYVAGCKDELLKTHNLHQVDCHELTKEAVDQACRRITRAELLAEALTGFSFPQALERSPSFKYFATKYELV
jgi:hypothetical protein